MGKGNFTPNAQLPRPVERGNCKMREHDTQQKTKVTKKAARKAGILSKKEGNPMVIKRRSYKNLRNPKLLTRGL